MEDASITQREIERLKKRRDELLNRSCTRFERAEIMKEIIEINRRLRVLHLEIGRDAPNSGAP